MAVRNIVKIDEDKCDGCGLCVTACAEGAIEVIDGKAKLVSEIYCDGLGACLGHCPQDAITIEKRDSAEFDEAATNAHLAAKESAKKPEEQMPCGCPGTMARQMEKKGDTADGDVSSQLTQWPVQLTLLSPQAPYFKNADLMPTADCAPFAMGDFHSKLLKGKAIAIRCPKLDDSQGYIEKLAEIIKLNGLQSLTVVHMIVPCCSGLTHIAKEAIRLSGCDMSFTDITIDLDGSVKKTETI